LHLLLPRVAGVVEHLAELFVEQLLLARTLRLEVVHAIELLFTHFPSLLRDADVGAQYDAADLVADEQEVPLRDLADEAGGLAVEGTELHVVAVDLDALRLDLRDHLAELRRDLLLHQRELRDEAVFDGVCLLERATDTRRVVLRVAAGLTLSGELDL